MAGLEADMNNSGIYMLLNKVTGLFYIGSATIFRKRKDFHNFLLRKNQSNSRYLQHAWNKYGDAAFEFRILEIVEDKTKLVEVEQRWIDWTRCYDPEIGYNICKIAESRLGLKSTKEHVAKIVAANKGQKRSPETCARIGAAKKGIKLAEKLKQARRNYRHTEEAKLKISEAGFGRKHTDEAKAKMSEKAKKRIKFRSYEKFEIIPNVSFING